MHQIEELAATIGSLPPSAGTTVVVGIDGFGGAGKSTIAERLRSQMPGAAVIHTDDFASWETPIEWWPRFLREVLQPLSKDVPAYFRRYDWETQYLAEWVTVAAPVVIVEGVSTLRREYRPYLAYGIWVECDEEVRLRRGLERSGRGLEPLWRSWMAQEARYAAEHRPQEFANHVMSGSDAWTPGTPIGGFTVRKR